ncbi:unnamed protein product [Camellia sinensis]
MARNNAQGENLQRGNSGASTASTSGSTSASAAIRVRSRPDPFLVVCRCFSIVTSAAVILRISVNILSAIRSFKDGSDVFVIAMFVVVAETEWGFIIKFWKILLPFREESGDEELSVLPRHTKVIVTGNNRTKSVLVGLQGVVKKAVGLGGWHWLVPRVGDSLLQHQRSPINIEMAVSSFNRNLNSAKFQSSIFGIVVPVEEFKDEEMVDVKSLHIRNFF